MIFMFKNSDCNLKSLLPGQFVFMICEDGSEHRGEIALRKAGLEIRDSIRWFHGSPVKHLTVVMGRKPIEGTVAENVLKYGCGGINVDSCRIKWATGRPASFPKAHEGFEGHSFKMNDRSHRDPVAEQNVIGRWPANVTHDGGECVTLFPDSKSGKLEPVDSTNWKSIPFSPKKGWNSHSMKGSKQVAPAGYGDDGSASRFFYTASTLEDLIQYLQKMVSTTED